MCISGVCVAPQVANRDPDAFHRADDFIYDRFVQWPEELERVNWGRGPANKLPTPECRMCPGTELVYQLAQMFALHVVLPYKFDFVETPEWSMTRLNQICEPSKVSIRLASMANIHVVLRIRLLGLTFARRCH